jgi:hypothetical protein
LDAIEGDARGPGAGKEYPPTGPEDDLNRQRPISEARVNVDMDVEEHQG